MVSIPFDSHAKTKKCSLINVMPSAAILCHGKEGRENETASGTGRGGGGGVGGTAISHIGINSGQPEVWESSGKFRLHRISLG